MEATGETTTTPSICNYYRAYSAFVRNALFRLGLPRSDLDDAVQEVFVVLCRLALEPGEACIAPLLTAITQRVYWNWRRWMRRHHPWSAHDALCSSAEALVDSRAESPDEAVGRDEMHQMVRAAIDRLSTKKREILWLAVSEGLSVTQIAERVGIPQNTAFSRLKAARADLKRELARLEISANHVPRRCTYQGCGGASAPAQETEA